MNMGLNKFLLIQLDRRGNYWKSLKMNQIFSLQENFLFNELLFQGLLKNIAWSAVNTLSGKHKENLPIIFLRMVSEKQHEKSFIEHLPIINQVLKYNISKCYIDSLNTTIDNLQLNNFFGHADEEVFSRLTQTKCKNGNLAFYQLCVRQKMLLEAYYVS